MGDVMALRATGLLETFSAAGVLGAADVHVATRLGAMTGETDDRVLLALALVVRGTRHGSIVLDLADVEATVTPEAEYTDPAAEPVPLSWPALDDWADACARSPLVADAPGGRPVHLVGTRLWLDRYWRQESEVAAELIRRASTRPADLDAATLEADLADLLPDTPDQRAAVSTAAQARISVIAGGPGTGKTTTIARLITALRRQLPQLRVALAAPTGKAAARLQEAVQGAAAGLFDTDREALATLSASTLHRLLGRRPGVSSRFRHNRENRLPFDLVVVDESSMVSLTLMARLLEALAPQARLVLVGDPDQLASVEAGAVLGDLVEPAGDDTANPMRESVAVLRTVHRFEAGGVIARLAQHVRDGEADEALALLESAPAGLEFHPAPDDEPLSGAALEAVRAQTAHELTMIEAARAGDVDAALAHLDTHRLLCAHRLGPRGVRQWSDAVERWLLADDPTLTPRLDGHYAGQPLLVTANDYENGLLNGDTGVVVEQGDDLVAAFRRGGAAVLLPLVRVAEVQPVHAMTVHRSQGSQFTQVTVLLPLATSPLATRQTFYTAITRASSLVRLVGSAESIHACITRRAARATGLRDRLAGVL